MTAIRAVMMPDGRVSVPAELRRRYGLLKGGALVLEDTGDGIVMRTREQAVKRARALSARLLEGKSGASVDDFLAERRRQAAAEG